MSKKIKASVYVITLNEEKNIANLLGSVQEFEEIIIVDSGSTDKTVQIASTYDNCKIFHQEWLGFAGQKAFALEKCSYDWVLNLDGDEEVSEEFTKEVRIATRQDDYVALSGPMVEDIFGKKPHKLTVFNDKIRCFKKQSGQYAEALVHESISIDGRVKKIPAPIYHHPNISLTDIIAKHNEYSELRAQEKLSRGKKIGVLKLSFIFPFAFVKSYFFKRNFLNGTAGFVMSMQIAYYAFCKYAKLWEKRNSL